jgi:hypothetical protein
MNKFTKDGSEIIIFFLTSQQAPEEGDEEKKTLKNPKML